jgi:hypothetical protein
METLFAEWFKEGSKLDSEGKYSGQFSARLKIFFEARHTWAPAIGAVNAFIALKHGSLEEIFLARVRDLHWREQIPPETIREIIAAWPDESRAFLVKAVKECKPDEVLSLAEAAFAEGGFPAAEALVLLNSSSKKVLDAAQIIFFNHEAEVRAEIEARLPKLKKAASLAAAQLIARWNARLQTGNVTAPCICFKK